MQIGVLVLIFLHLPFACFQPSPFMDSVNCSQGLGCRLLGTDGLCTTGETVPDPERDAILVLTHMETSDKLRCQKAQDCIPCVQVTLRLGLLEPPAVDAKQDGGATKNSMQPKRHNGTHGEFLKTHLLIRSWAYPSSRCVAVEIWLPHGHDWNNSSLGFLHFDCFPVAIGGELYVTALTSPPYLSAGRLQHIHYGPDCSWHKAQDAIRLCQVPKLEVSMGPEEAVLYVSDLPEGQYFCLLLYLNQTHGSEDVGEGKIKLIVSEGPGLITARLARGCHSYSFWTEIVRIPPLTPPDPGNRSPRKMYSIYKIFKLSAKRRILFYFLSFSHIIPPCIIFALRPYTTPSFLLLLPLFSWKGYRTTENWISNLLCTTFEVVNCLLGEGAP